MTRTRLVLFAIACFLVGVRLLMPKEIPPPLAPTVLLVSIDGFRADYLDRFQPPHLAKLAKQGVRATGMIPAFPAVTFPNHYTLVTGLYPGHHGILNNTFYDAAEGRWFEKSGLKEERWWGGTPLWVTAAAQGQRSATYFWIGSEAPIHGQHPTYWKPYDETVSGEARVDGVLAWLDLPPAERPTFLTLYFGEVDDAGHDFGPDSEEVRQAVGQVDAYLGRLMAGLAARGITDQVNLVVVSDHGMAATQDTQVVFLEDYLDVDHIEHLTYSPTLLIWPKAGETEAVYRDLQAVPHLEAYRTEETPSHWHYRDHPSLPPLVGLPEEGWHVVPSRKAFRPGDYAGGTHGYAPRLPSMHALFVAHGPAFKQGVQVAPFENVHVYPLLAHVLGLRPAPHDGDLQAVAHLLARRAAIE